MPDAVRCLVQLFFAYNLILNAYQLTYMDLLINKKTMSVSFSCVPQAVYIFSLVDGLSESTVFFCSPLSVHIGMFYCTAHHHLFVNVCFEKNFAVYVYTFNSDYVNICFENNFALYTYDSDYPDTLLN